jgi:hypothetical protein
VLVTTVRPSRINVTVGKLYVASFIYTVHPKLFCHGHVGSTHRYLYPSAVGQHVCTVSVTWPAVRRDVHPGVYPEGQTPGV